jgi:hypothetical protein
LSAITAHQLAGHVMNSTSSAMRPALKIATA